MDMVEDNEVYTVVQTATYLKVNEATVRRKIKSGELKASFLGHRIGYRIEGKVINQYLRKRGVKNE